jgi:hypothetical protein
MLEHAHILYSMRMIIVLAPYGIRSPTMAVSEESVSLKYAGTNVQVMRALGL